MGQSSGNSGGGGVDPLKAVAQEISYSTGGTRNLQEIESEADGERQTIKYKREINWSFVRFNFYFL